MHFHILGLGPIGSLVAHNLRRYLPRETGVTLIIKNNEQASQRRSKLVVDCAGAVTTSSGFFLEVFDNSPYLERQRPPYPKQRTLPKPGRALPPEADVKRSETPISSLIVTAKAHQTIPALRQLQPRLSPNSTIVLLQNGMGIYEELLEHVFRNPEHRPHFILASNSHGAFAFENKIVHAGLGAIDIGITPDFHGRNFEVGLEDPSRATQRHRIRLADIATSGDSDFEQYQSLRDTVAALTKMPHLNVSWLPISDLQLAMRRKVVVNSVINPLTAIMRCRNGDLFKSEAARDISRRVCEEATRGFIAQIKSETTEYLRTAAQEPNSMDIGRMPPSLMADSLEQEVIRVAQMTGGNKSSMLADVERGRETEIDYINGYLLRIGSAFGVAMPTIRTLCNLVKMRSDIPLDQMF